MILVDTSVLIDYLTNHTNKGVEKFNEIVRLNIPFGITPYTYQELLQGVASQTDYDSLKIYLDTFIFYAVKDNKDSYAQAAHLYFLCRRKGVTVSSTIDVLIFQTAREHHLKLLHNDSDFTRMARVIGDVEFF